MLLETLDFNSDALSSYLSTLFHVFGILVLNFTFLLPILFIYDYVEKKKSVEYLVFTRLGFVVVSMFDLVDKKNYFLFFFFPD